jgi:energy-coupling factor transporter ATP-binding protein EcfA2
VVGLQTADIRDYFTFQSPFGPSNIDDRFSVDALRQLFEDSVRPYDSVDPRDCTYIVGRRGSGKTTLLTASTGFGSRLTLRLHESSVLGAMRDTLIALEDEHSKSLNNDDKAELWRAAFYAAGAAFFAVETPSSISADMALEGREFLASLNRGRAEPLATPAEVVCEFLDCILDVSRTNPIHGAFTTWLRSIRVGSHSVRELSRLVDSALDQSDQTLTILIDSLDELNRRPEYFAEALRPLFSILGSQDPRVRRRSRVIVRCCLPTEIKPRFPELSENPNKDLQNVCYLHWKTSDLMTLCVSRLQRFAKILSDDGDSRLARRLDLVSAGDAQSVICSMLPRQVENLVSHAEDSLPYILRHTQLLPRQLLKMLNMIAGGQSRMERFMAGGAVSAQEVLASVQRAETELAGEVVNAFKATHPSAGELLMRLVPNLPSRLTSDVLSELYEKLSLREHARGFEHCRDMLIEMGVLGRVERETRQYLRGQFAYTIPDGFNPAMDDELCLHPMFSQHKGRRPSAVKPVYPAAVHIDDELINWA